MKKLAIGANFKGTAAGWDECKRLDAFAEFENLGRQTDGLGRVVSNHAVFDRYFGFHSQLLSETEVIGAMKRGQEPVEAAVSSAALKMQAARLPLQRDRVLLRLPSRFVSTITRGRRRFASGFFTHAGSEKIGKHGEELHLGRFMIHTEQRRNIEARIATRLPCGGRADNKAVIGSSAAFLVAEAAELKLDASFELFVRKKKWSEHTLRDAPFTAAVASDFLFEKGIQRPFKAAEEFLRQEKSQFISVGNGHGSVEPAGSKLLGGGGRAFIVQNIADAELVFGKDCRVERNLVPVRKRITSFDGESRVLARAVISLDRVLDGQINSIRQADFDFLSKSVVGTAVVNDVVLVNEAGINLAGRKHVCVGQRRETRLGETAGCTVRAGNFLAGNSDLLGSSCLRVDRMIDCEEGEIRAAD
jgi:hypothetical protein